MPRIRKLKVDFISLVDEPANQKSLIFKSNDGLDFHYEIALKHIRKDALKGFVYATVYEPDTVDTQDDWIEQPDLTETAHDFLKEGRVKMVDLHHNYQAGYGTVVESFIKNGADDRYPDSKNGSWCVAIKLEDIAKQHIDEIKGVSMAGKGAYDRTSAPPAPNVTQKSINQSVAKQGPLVRRTESNRPIARIIKKP